MALVTNLDPVQLSRDRLGTSTMLIANDLDPRLCQHLYLSECALGCPELRDSLAIPAHTPHHIVSDFFLIFEAIDVCRRPSGTVTRASDT